MDSRTTHQTPATATLKDPTLRVLRSDDLTAAAELLARGIVDEPGTVALFADRACASD